MMEWLVAIATILTVADYTIRIVKWLYRKTTKPRYRPKHLKRK